VLLPFSGRPLSLTAVTPGTYTATNLTVNAYGQITAAASGSGGGGGTVTSVSVVTSNGVSGTVATASTTPAITLTLGAIVPSSVNSVVISGSSTPTLAVTGTSTISGSNTGDQTNITGNAGTVTGLSVTSGKTLTVDNSLELAGTDSTKMTFPSTSATIARTDAANTFTGHQTIEGVTSTGATGTGNLVFSSSPTLTSPALGTPSALVGTNISGTAANLTAGTVTTNANLTGDVTSSGNATTLATVNSNVGSYTYASITVNGKGLVTAAANGSAPLTNPMTTLGDIIYENATPAPARLAGNTSSTKNYLVQTGSGSASAAPTWGTIAVGDVPTLNQNTTGNAATVTTNANLTGVITSSGNATSTGAQTGTGNTFVMSVSPALTSTPTAPTQTAGDNSTAIATDAFVTTAIANAIAGVDPAIAVNVATTTASNTSGLTYLNGVSGVGATFTGSINTALTFDGVTLTSGMRVLIKNDTQTTGGASAGAFNGIYSVTQIQTIAVPPILTRVLDYDTTSDINNTGAIPVLNGTANALTSWLLNSTVTTVGTSAITYTQFSFSPTNVVPANLGGTGIANNVASTITISGSYATTLTLTNTTSITLPTSGTLVNTGVATLSSLTSVGTITTGGLGTGAVIGGVTMTLGSDASYDTYYRGSGGVLTRLANGTTGQVLTATTSNAPGWSAPATSGTVTSVSVATANGFSGTVANSTTTPAITIIAGAIAPTSVNGLTISTTTGTLTVTNGKTLKIDNTLELAGTDSTVMTFPSTSATIARTDAANTFTGHQTIEGVTSTGATGTGNLVFSASPGLTGTPTAPTQTTGDNTTAIATDAFVQSAVAQPNILSDAFMGSVLQNIDGTTESITLTASEDFVVSEILEIGATKLFEIPATTSLEIESWVDQPFFDNNPVSLVVGGVFDSNEGATANITLPINTDFISDYILEVSPSYFVEIPNSSTLEITAWIEAATADTLKNKTIIDSSNSIGYGALLPTIFSSQVTTATNGGTGGGTFQYANIGGIKYLWGRTSVVNLSGSGNQTTTVGVTLPTFFNNLQMVLAQAGVNNNQFLFGGYAAASSSALSVTLTQIAGTNGSATIEFMIIGN
jgi:hypothetical protein